MHDRDSLLLDVAACEFFDVRGFVQLSRQAREVQSSRGVTERKTIDDDDDSGKQDDDDGVAFGEGVSSWGTGTDSMASLPSGTQTSGLGQSNGNSNTAGYTPRDYSDIWATNVEF